MLQGISHFYEKVANDQGSQHGLEYHKQIYTLKDHGFKPSIRTFGLLSLNKTNVNGAFYTIHFWLVAQLWDKNLYILKIFLEN